MEKIKPQLNMIPDSKFSNILQIVYFICISFMGMFFFMYQCLSNSLNINCLWVSFIVFGLTLQVFTIYVKHIESKYDLTSEELAEKIKEYLWRDKEI